MDLPLKFITALAWIIGGLMAFGVACGLALMVAGDHTRKTRMDIAEFLLWGIIPWAWLLARYCL